MQRGKRKLKEKKKTSGTKNKRIITKIFLIFVCVGSALGAFYYLCVRTPYFDVKEVYISGRRSPTVDYAKLKAAAYGKNIFKVNLSDIRNKMLKEYPELMTLQLTRVFPDTVIASTSLRQPIAQLYKDHYYPVDREGVLLSGVRSLPLEGLVIVTGTRGDLSRKVGQRLDDARLDASLALLEGIRSSDALNGHRLIEIDVSNLRNIIFFLEDGLEIKIGRKGSLDGLEFAERLENLRSILRDPKIRPSEIRYIDLRFEEPVIGPRWRR